MTLHLVKLLVLPLALAMFQAPLHGADLGKVKEWNDYFVGEWTRNGELVLDGKTTKTHSDWSCTTAAAGAAIIATGKGSDGTEWVNLSGWDDSRKAIHEFGKMSTGDSWHIDFKMVDSNTLKGKATGALADGRKGRGECTIKRTGKDSYTAVFELTLDDNSTFNVTEHNNRK